MAITTATRQQHPKLGCVMGNGALSGERPIEAIVPTPR